MLNKWQFIKTSVLPTSVSSLSICIGVRTAQGLGKKLSTISGRGGK